VFLQRIYVLFFISLARRRIEYVACSSNPDGRWHGRPEQEAPFLDRRQDPVS